MNPLEFVIGIAPAIMIVAAIVIALGSLLYFAAYGAFAFWTRRVLVSHRLRHQFAAGALFGLTFIAMSILGWVLVPSESLGQVIVPFAGMLVAGFIGLRMAFMAIREVR